MKQEQFKQLVEYVIIEPKDDSDPKRAFRFPFYACELLCCDTAKVFDTFFPKDDDQSEDGQKTGENQVDGTPTPVTDEQQQQQNNQKKRYELFDYFCSFITTADPNNYNIVLAGYFAKVFNSFINRRQEIVLNHLLGDPDQKFINSLINMTSSRSLSELIVKFLAFEKELNLADDTQFLKQRLSIIQSLINFLKLENQNYEVKQAVLNIQLIFQDLFQKIYSISQNVQIINYLLSNECFQDLCQLVTSKNRYTAISASNIVYSLLQLAYNDQFRPQENDESDRLNLDLNESLQIIKKQLPEMNEYLLQKQNESIELQIKPLGQAKLKIIETFYLLLKIKYEEFQDELSKINIFKSLNQLFQIHDQNNQFHLQYHKIISTVIESEMKPLLQNLFEQNQFIGYLIQMTLNLETMKIIKRCQNGFITKIGKILEDIGDKNELIKSYLQSKQIIHTNKILAQDWTIFKRFFYQRTVEDNDKDLGGLSNTRERGPSEDQFDFNKEELQNRFKNFMSGEKEQAVIEQQSIPESNGTSSNIFEQFGNSQSEATSAIDTSNFEGFGWTSQNDSAPNTSLEIKWDASQAQSESGWDSQISQPVNQSSVQDSSSSELLNQSSISDTSSNFSQFWKIESDEKVFQNILQLNNQIISKAFDEFEDN